jgi:predicted transporter
MLVTADFVPKRLSMYRPYSLHLGSPEKLLGVAYVVSALVSDAYVNTGRTLVL